ncbi:MAG TPA: DUF202 domain-containing protein [Bacteroidia bacterium]|nr:DUF202 domain-containing protein [Bacteroidia bacterium]
MPEKSREHQANERTFLAWIRTSLAILILGFAIFRLNIFLREMAIVNRFTTEAPATDLSSVFGIILIAFGVLITLLAYFQFLRIEKQLHADTYQPSSYLVTMLALFIIIAGTILVFSITGNL